MFRGQKEIPEPRLLASFANRRFRPEQGATVRASLLSRAWTRIIALVSDLKFRLGRSRPEERAQRETSAQNRKGLHLVGGFLSSLTARADDAEEQSRIAQELRRLCSLSQEDARAFQAGLESPPMCLGELQRGDIFALREGALGRQDVRDAVLARFLTDESRTRAAGILARMEAALSRRVARDVVQEPMSEIVELLSRSPLDGQKLGGQLIKLHTGLAMLDPGRPEDGSPVNSTLDVYFQSLPLEHSGALLGDLHSQKLNAAEHALSLLSDDLKHQALAMLNRLRTAVNREIRAQAQPDLLLLKERLKQAARHGDRFAASLALGDLNALVDKSRRICDPLPEGMLEDVRELVDEGVVLIRDAENNPGGPLNAVSLNRLDDLSLGFLRGASSLHALGLELDTESGRGVALGRVGALSRQAVGRMTDMLRTLAEDPGDVSLLMRQLRGLADVEMRRIEQLTELGQFPDGLDTDECRSMVQEMCELAECRSPDPTARILPHTFYQTLEAQYGIVYQAGRSSPYLLSTDSDRAVIAPFLEQAHLRTWSTCSPIFHREIQRSSNST